MSDEYEDNEESSLAFMAVLHLHEEQVYGPMSPLPIKAKVFLCIRHKTVRWGKYEKPISYKEIAESVGENVRSVIRAIQDLEQHKAIIVKRTQTEAEGHVSNILGLNRDVFGDFIRPRRKKKESKPRGENDSIPSDKKDSSPTVKFDTSLVTNSPLPLVSKMPLPLVTNLTLPTGFEAALATVSRSPKESIKEKLKKSLKERKKSEESFTLSGGREAEVHRQKVFQQLEDMKAGRIA